MEETKIPTIILEISSEKTCQFSGTAEDGSETPTVLFQQTLIMLEQSNRFKVKLLREGKQTFSEISINGEKFESPAEVGNRVNKGTLHCYPLGLHDYFDTEIEDAILHVHIDNNIVPLPTEAEKGLFRVLCAACSSTKIQCGYLVRELAFESWRMPSRSLNLPFLQETSTFTTGDVLCFADRNRRIIHYAFALNDVYLLSKLGNAGMVLVMKIDALKEVYSETRSIFVFIQSNVSHSVMQKLYADPFRVVLDSELDRTEQSNKRKLSSS